MTKLARSEVDDEGLHHGRAHTISTWTKRRIDPTELTVEDIDIVDIAHALARQCRYNGHTYGHLSVARHSLWVADRVKHMTRNDALLELTALLHDAAEAYLGDMVKPLKVNPKMKAFSWAERRAEQVIAEVFGVPFPMPPEVIEADRYVTVELELTDRRYSWNSDAFVDEAQFLTRFQVLEGRLA